MSLPSYAKIENTNLKTIINTSLLVFLFLAASSLCFALQLIDVVSRERAEKEFGVKITSQTVNPNQANVSLEFRPTGKLKGFSHVRLEITDGDKNLVSASLLVEPSGKSVTVYFSTDPAHVSVSKLTIVVRTAERTTVGYQLNVKDFIKQEASR